MRHAYCMCVDEYSFVYLYSDISAYMYMVYGMYCKYLLGAGSLVRLVVYDTVYVYVHGSFVSLIPFHVMRVCIMLYTCLCINIRTRICIYTYVSMYIYIHTYTII